MQHHHDLWTHLVQFITEGKGGKGMAKSSLAKHKKKKSAQGNSKKKIVQVHIAAKTIE